jgi:putative inorganic carbon (hco3(-)) transporter
VSTQGIRSRWALAAIGAAIVVALVVLAPAPVRALAPTVVRIGGTAVAAAAIVYIAWIAEPAWTLSAALVLAPFSGSWTKLGLSGTVAPDRVLLIIGIAAVILRAPGVGRRLPLRVHPLHWLLAITAAYAVVSALISHTFFDAAAFFGLFEHLGILSYLLFFVAPVAFRTQRHRQVLLGALVGLGAYLGLTALFETVGPRALVVPSYINDPNYGIHYGRARGPFVEAVSNGVGLFACAVAAAIALATWRRRGARLIALAVLILCTAGMLFTLQRSVWLGAVAAAIVTVVAFRELRRYLLPLALAGALTIGAALTLVPGLQDKVSQRESDQRTVWDRQNLATAALNMLDQRPLTGFGWGRFADASRDRFWQAANYPLTGAGLQVHNVPLRYAAELGLIGVTLWVVGILLGVAGGLTGRGPPDLRAWRMGLVAIASFYAIVSSFVPPQLFPTMILWTWIGVTWAGRLQEDEVTVRAPLREPVPA